MSDIADILGISQNKELNEKKQYKLKTKPRRIKQKGVPREISELVEDSGDITPLSVDPSHQGII